MGPGRHRVERLALTLLWLPEEGPGDILCVKQLPVVALLTSILLLFDGGSMLGVAQAVVR